LQLKELLPDSCNLPREAPILSERKTLEYYFLCSTFRM